MTRLAREKFPQGKVGDTVNVRVWDVDRGRCDSRNNLGVIMEADLTKDLYRIGTKDGRLNSWYTRNQFSSCTEGTDNIADVPSVSIWLRKGAGKAPLFGGQRHRRRNWKTSCRSNLCSCKKSNKLCNCKCHNSLSWENKLHLFWHHHVLHFFALFFFSFYY